MTIQRLTTEDLIGIAQRKGMRIVRQTGFTKIFSADNPRKALYVAHAKNGVARVDVSGFEPAEHRAIKPVSAQDAKLRRLGAVRGQIVAAREGVTSRDILEAFEMLLGSLDGEDEGFKSVRRSDTSPGIVLH